MSYAVCSFRHAASRLTVCSVFAVVIGLPLSACTSRDDQPAAAFTKSEGQLLVRAKNIKWSAAPTAWPQGAKVALLQGDPNAAGRYVMRVQLPANYKIPFHQHSNAMDVTVLSGTLYVANTQTYEKKKAFAVNPGDFYHLPALAPQFSFTKKETVLEIHGDGPYDVKYASVADDPLKGATPPAHRFTAGFEANDINAAESDDIVDMTY